MTLAIIAVLGFQLYWLFKSYQEEKRVLRIRTNALFREAVFQSQAEKFRLDSNSKVRVSNQPIDAVNMIDIVRRRIDSAPASPARKTSSTMIISMNEEGPGEVTDRMVPTPHDTLSGTVRFYKREGNGQALIQILQGVDSLQDSVTVKEVSEKFSRSLNRQKIAVKYLIDRQPTTWHERAMPIDFESENKVTVGIAHPATFTMTIQNQGIYLLKKMSIPIMVSILLVGLTIASFIIMLRNLMHQRRLAQVKNEFVSNITHELKTPIATVGVAIEALKNFNALNDPQKTKEYLDISAAEVHRLGLLVDKVLKLSMFENREIALQRENLDLLDLTQEVMASMKLQFEKQQARVTLETEGNNFVVEADKLHITSVVYNLLDNALKYSKDKPEIDVSLVSHKEHVSLSVSDKGIGIPKEYKGRIFEKFFRIPGGDRHNIKGYGLGLSYVNHIVQKHMGFVEVKSELGKGSTFTVHLPYKEADVIHFDEHRRIRKKSI